MGYQAGNVITTGSNNVIIGYDADPSANDASNQIVIGKDATGQGDNYAVIGNASVTRVYAAQDAGATLYAGGLNIGGTAVTSTAAELNLVDGSSAGTIVSSKGVVYGSSGEVNATTLQIAGTSITSTAAELNLMDGVTATTAEINYLDGVTSNIQTQIDNASGASNVTGLSDALVESNSIWLGNDPSSSTNTANTSIGIGTTALDQVTTGDDNVAVGYNALTSITDSHRNVAVGKGALSNTTASNNVAVGNDAGNLITTGSSNTYLGYNSDGSANSVSNETAIGANAIGQGSNTITVGDDNVTAVYLSEDKGATVYAGALDVTAAGGITLQNDETITNSTDGTVEIGGSLTGTGSISGFDANLNDQTGTAYTLTSSDNGKVLTLNNANAITLTIAASLGDGFNCLIVQKGAGQVTLSAAGGVTVVNRSSETKTAGQYATVSVINIGSEQYILSGDTGS